MTIQLYVTSEIVKTTFRRIRWKGILMDMILIMSALRVKIRLTTKLGSAHYLVRWDMGVTNHVR